MLWRPFSLDPKLRRLGNELQRICTFVSLGDLSCGRPIPRTRKRFERRVSYSEQIVFDQVLFFDDTPAQILFFFFSFYVSDGGEGGRMMRFVWNGIDVHMCAYNLQ